MRKAIRFQKNQDYWDQRWSRPDPDAGRFARLDIYPIKYAEMVKPEKGGCIAELGCGLGRVVKHFHQEGFNMVGVERSRVAVERMKRDDHALNVLAGDVVHMPFREGAFDAVVSFGLYHNIEHGLPEALKETARCMKRGARFAIAVRPDNFEMRLNESYWRIKERRRNQGPECFHKWLFGEREFGEMLAAAGLDVERVFRDRIVSLFWRVSFLRDKGDDKISDGERRSRGYTLNALGRFLDRLCRGLFPYSFCNILVYVGRKR